MILLVGGLGAGKRQYVTETLGYTAEDISHDPQDSKAVLMDLHECIRQAGAFDDAWLDTLLVKEVVVCNEVGSGVVPLDAHERMWRDEVGRASILLAERADLVIRLVCGIPQILKGELV